MVGLVGYPNVGKSSTINSIFGSKKTAVAPTPGKTKHFQTLNVSPTLCLCDCPGLVFPRFAASKADMVAAGVVPIDKLTEIRGPVAVVAARAGRHQLNAVYGIRVPPPEPHEPPTAPPKPGQVLMCVDNARLSGLSEDVGSSVFVWNCIVPATLIRKEAGKEAGLQVVSFCRLEKKKPALACMLHTVHRAMRTEPFAAFQTFAPALPLVTGKPFCRP